MMITWALLERTELVTKSKSLSGGSLWSVINGREMFASQVIYLILAPLPMLVELSDQRGASAGP